jgi:hypothetical protein
VLVHLRGLKGPESIAQALAWVYISNRTALKGREKIALPNAAISGASSGHDVKNKLPRVNPGLCFLAPLGRSGGDAKQISRNRHTDAVSVLGAK